MVADFQTSMKEIREANLAFISLLTQLKHFISNKGTVTIRTYRWEAGADVVDQEFTLPTIPSIIDAYRGGRFDEIILKSGDTEIHLKNNNGTLQIIDKDGNLVLLEVAKLRYASIANCVVDTATVRECVIDTLEALGGIDVNRVSCQDLNIAGLLDAASGTFASLGVSSLTAESASVRKLAVRSMVFNPDSHASIFAGAAPYNYAAGNAVFEPMPSSGLCAYVCAPDVAPADWKDPATMGFTELVPGYPRVLQAPDMMTFQGNTKCSDYDGTSYRIANCYAVGTGPQGTSIEYSQSLPAMSEFDNGACCPFALILGWPIRSFVRDPGHDGELPPVMAGFDKGVICVHEFSSLDIGRIMYIRTLGNKWKVPRRLTTKYVYGKLQRSRLDLVYEIPPYTSLRVRLARHVVVDGSDTYYHNVLELT